MMDIITHVSNLELFREEAKALAVAENEDGSKLVPDLYYNAETDELVYGVTKIQVVYSMPESITLIRTNDDRHLQNFEHFHRIGVCVNKNEYVFDSIEAKETYERIYKPFEVLTYTDEDGNEQTYQKPYMMGVIA